MNRQALVDDAATALSALLDAMAEVERGRPTPEKWDEEYAGHAIDDCLDRLFCAPEAGMPIPSDAVRELYRAARDRAAPFVSEDVPLPGSFEEDQLARAQALWLERWPEGGAWDDLAESDPRRQALWMEAARDAERARRAES